jgi:hypothetical protein
VILPPRVKPPTKFTKFSGQDDTSTVEHIARYLMQLGEASADEAFRVRYFPLSLTRLAVINRISISMVYFFASSVDRHMEGSGAKVPCPLL